MSRRASVLTFLLAAAAAAAQAPLPLPPDLPGDAIAHRAAAVRPSARQLAWQATGMNAFVHFGMNTFTDREWGDGSEDPAAFAPSDFDADQWARAFAAAGMGGVILTCKHHDGFCLWPTATTEHSVARSPFRAGIAAGPGDVVAEVAAACRRHGLRFGVYLSPWDRHQPSFGTPAYHAVYLAQLRELCTGYGELFEVWCDGAHCPADDPALFDWQQVFRLVRELQPNAVIAITGPDVRWVGNEAGKTRESEWSVLPLAEEAPGPFEADRQSWRALWSLRERNQDADLGSRERLANARGLCWWPAETDVSIRPGWFWHATEDTKVKPVATLLDYWYGAVGGNAVLLLNVPADRRGRIPDADVAVLQQLGDTLRATFTHDLGEGATRHHRDDGGLEIELSAPVTVDVFDLAEDLASSGQCIETFRIEVRERGRWRECANGTTVGFRRCVRTEPVTGDAFRCVVTAARGGPRLAHFALHRRP